ncbi:MAG: hypothetical protein IK099_05980 [Clostridia bacterium]|nr:hypothetical protein [Clostridia bacterium]
MDSIIFFEESDLVVGEDRVVKERDGSETHIKTGAPTIERISANTIVVNTNRIRRDFSAFNIFHECISSWQFQYHESRKTLRHESTVKINFETGDYAKTHEQFRDTEN